MEPREIATNHTLSFLKERLPPRPCRILEVGCGLGHLAKALVDLGHNVLAIDTAEEAVNSTKRRGVNATVGAIEDVTASVFDFVLFTRSLHHIHHIDRCLSAAKDKLRSGGTVIVEDFGYDLMDEPTAIWFQGLKNVARPLLKSETEDAISLEEAYVSWISHHTDEHGLHKAAELEDSLRKHFSGLETQKDVPYLYRYLIPDTPPSKETYKSIAAAFSWEKVCIARNEIKGIGLRLLANSS